MADEGCDERSLPGSETESNFSEGPYSDMCVPALELLSKVSKKLASIYVKPANVIFHGSHAVKLDNSSSPLSSPSSPIMSVADTIKDASTLAPNYARSITAIDDSGILRVWYLMIDVLTTTVITCPRKYQLQALDTLFDVLHSVSSVPGPQFSILVMTNLLLPMLHSWLERGTQTPEYWDRTAGNFKQACGLTTELIVGEMGQFLSDQGRLSKRHYPHGEICLEYSPWSSWSLDSYFI
jgi:brefeldin A-inhibited guanine nucleotide-exchange protein 3